MKARWVRVALAGATLAMIWTSVAHASWGANNECKFSETSHCYSLSFHKVSALASIVFMDPVDANVSDWESGAFTTHEQWISFGNETEWIETGDISGYGMFGCCSPHPFYAEQKGTSFKLELSPGVVPVGYNHFVLYDAERNGRWHIYWNCCEVGYYGGGWPEKFSEQEAGVEADDNPEPGSLARQEVAWSQGGEWFAWTGAGTYVSPGLCVRANPESGAAGNIQAGTKRGASESGQPC